MQFIRKTTLGLAASLLFTLLFVFGLAFSAQRVLGTPGSLKHALKASGLYESGVGDALNQAQKDQPSGQGEGIPIDRPEVQNVIKQAASPQFLQTQTEQALDSVYAWMQGKSAHLTFSVDLTEVKVRLADGMAQYVQQHLATLPACPAGTGMGDVDPFKATCVPQGTDTSQVAAAAKNEILNGEFLKDSTTVTADTIKTENGKTLEQQLKELPTIYQRVNQGVYAAGLLVILLMLAVIFLSANWRAGVRKVAITGIAIGLFSALIAWLSRYGVDRATEQLAQSSGNIQPLQQKALAAGELLFNDFRAWWLGYGITLMVLGVVALVVLTATEGKGPKPEKLAAEPSKKSDSSKIEPSTLPPAADPKPAVKSRPTKLVQ